MKRLLHAVWNAGTSRIVPPLVVGFFLVVYIGIAFFTEDALTVLMDLTRRYTLLAAVLALLPLHSMARIVAEVLRHRIRRRALRDAGVELPAGLFDERVEMAAPPALEGLEKRLGSAGYRTSRSGNLLSAWRGVGIFPAQILFLAGASCLFAGILISLVGRTVSRGSIIEGEPLQTSSGISGVVERISFANAVGPILAKDLKIHVSGLGAGSGTREFGVYPPARFDGNFVYLRYLGVATHLRISAPDLDGEFQKSAVLPIYPPGREAPVEIPRSSYRLVISLAKPDDGSDPYMTGRMNFNVNLLRGKDLLLRGSVPVGGEFRKDGYRISVPDARRMVITDFTRDNGLPLVASAAILIVLAGLAWVPVRLFFPRREMLFRSERGALVAYARAEGKGRGHLGLFHELLDIMEAGRPEPRPGMDEDS